MKVLMVNKYFYPRGGSERVFFDTAGLLESHGHRVNLFSMAHPRNLPSPDSRYFVSQVDFDERMSLRDRFKTAGRILYFRGARHRIEEMLRQNRPDIVHLHNIHHQISPSIIPAVKSFGCPVVMTLHDYKMVCATYRLFRRGKVCQKCGGGRHYWCLLTRCNRNSLLQSLLCTVEMYLHQRWLDLYGGVDTFISPSLFLKEKLKEMGFKKRIIHLPNFVDAGQFPAPAPGEKDLFLFLGRLSAEKGLLTLLRAFRGLPARLHILGEGPLQKELEAAVAGENKGKVTFCGHKSKEEVKDFLRTAAAVIIPSEWYENNPITILEAYAAGKPVIGSRIGGIPELIREGETGLLFEPANWEELRAKITLLLRQPRMAEIMGRKARKLAEKDFNPRNSYRRLLGIYEELLPKPAGREAARRLK